MYTRSYDSNRPVRLPPRYGGSTFQIPEGGASIQTQAPETDLFQKLGLGSLSPLFGHPPVAGTPAFDELLILGLIFLLLGSDGGRDLVPILALLLFCNP